MKTETIKVFVERYAYPRKSVMHDTLAIVVGALAVHRPVYWWDGEAPQGDNCGRNPEGWTVIHVASGKSVASVHHDRCIGCKRADLLKWAQDWQDACPDWFAALAAVPDWATNNEPILQVDKDLTRSAIDIGRKISRGEVYA